MHTMLQKIKGITSSQVAIGVLVSMVTGLGVWVSAQATGAEISMCVKQSGVSYVIGTGFDKQSCKDNEQLLTFNIQGPQGIQGPIGPQGPEGSSVKVYDANNQVIGYVTGTGGELVEFMDKNLGILIRSFLYTSPSEIIGLNNPIQLDIFYPTNNCSGQGYVDSTSDKLAYFLINPPGVGYYYAVDKTVVAPGSVNYHSKGGYIPTSGPCVAEDGEIFSPVPVKDAQTILDSYARPFHIGL